LAEAKSARRKLARLLKFGVLMDVLVLQQFCKDNIPSITFQVDKDDDDDDDDDDNDDNDDEDHDLNAQ
jgi:hypothetical protein